MDYNDLATLFRDPPAAYRPMVFWLWNGDITADGIREAVADFAAKGCGGFFLHPMGESFRLPDFVQGMSPAYLSEDYFALVRVAAEAARDQGLLCWLYDEGGWPSGSAQGHALAGHPELARLHLVASRLRGEAGDWHSSPDIVAAVGVPEVGIPEPIEPRDLAHALTPYAEIVTFTLEPDTSFIDVMNPAAVRRFVEVTHERYAETVGDLFGSTIPGIFTDETPLGGRAGTAAVPWTRLMLENLSAELGRDARAYLPLLFDPAVVGEELAGRYTEHERAAARCAYYECATRLFREAYWEQITEWCRGHGLIHTGHVGGEDNLPDHLHFGHFFRTAGALDAPGVDTIWRQLEPGADNFPFPRFAQSAQKRRARQPDGALANLTLTETNAVYGYGLEYGQMRWLADYQFQCGVSLYAPMAAYYTTEGGRLYGTMSHFGPGSPLWTAYPGFADYVGRQCVLARHCVEQAEVTVYYPIEALWSDPEATKTSWADLRELCGLLLESQCAFDFVDADTLGSVPVIDGALQLPQARYRVVLVPRLLAMPSAAVERLADLAEAGGTVVFTGGLPAFGSELGARDTLAPATDRLTAAGARVLTISELAEQAETLLPHAGPLRLTDPLPELLLSVRRCGDSWVCLATNNSDGVLQPAFNVQSEASAMLEVWDLRDGESASLMPVGDAVQDFRPLIPPWSSEVFVIRPGDGAADPPPTGEAEALLGRWLATPPERRPPHVLGADVAVYLDTAEEMRVREQSIVVAGGLQVVRGADAAPLATGAPVPLGLWDDWAALQDFSGQVDYMFSFVLAPELAARPMLLDLGAVYWAASVELNGSPLPPSLWPPHTLDVTGQVQVGENRLVVTVGNTLANAVCAPPAVAEAEARGWCNAYWRRVQPMMTDRRSGLLGPVRLLMLRFPAD